MCVRVYDRAVTTHCHACTGNGAKDKAGTQACQWDEQTSGGITDASCNKFDACSQEKGETGCTALGCEWSDNSCFSKDTGGGEPGAGGGTGKEAVRMQVCADREIKGGQRERDRERGERATRCAQTLWS